MKNILISNDDGIFAPGIFATKTALEDFSNVVVVAPKENNSSVGRKLSLFKPLNVEECFLEDDFKAYCVSGSPADSVNIGINYILDEKPDLVVTGINKGVNIGKCELTSSGTVCAAMEAVSNRVPAIACSLCIDPSSFIQDDDGQWRIEVNFDLAKKILADLTKKVLDDGMPKGVNLLNLNIPEKPSSSKIKVTRLAERMLNPNIEVNENDGSIMIAPYLIEEYEEGTDGYCLMVEKRPSLTPLNMDLTGNIDILDDWL